MSRLKNNILDAKNDSDEILFYTALCKEIIDENSDNFSLEERNRPEIFSGAILDWFKSFPDEKGSVKEDDTFVTRHKSHSGLKTASHILSRMTAVWKKMMFQLLQLSKVSFVMT